MKRVLFALFALSLITGCGESGKEKQAAGEVKQLREVARKGAKGRFRKFHVIMILPQGIFWRKVRH